MFGFSAAKLLLLAFVIAAVWYGFKYMNRLEELRRLLRQMQGSAPARAPRAGAPGLKAEDLVLCRRCNAYVAAHGAGSCGRADCPWGR